NGGIVTITGEGTIIRCNFIGTNGAGTAALPNGSDGVNIVVPNVVVGGPIPAARNVISGNASNGIGVFATTSSPGGPVLTSGTGALVQGNYIGTNAAGTMALPNQSAGVCVGVPTV